MVISRVKTFCVYRQFLAKRPLGRVGIFNNSWKNLSIFFYLRQRGLGGIWQKMGKKAGEQSSPLRYGFDFDFKILTALKGWVGHAPQGRGALHIIYRLCAIQ